MHQKYNMLCGPPLLLILSIATVATKALVATADLHDIPIMNDVITKPIEQTSMISTIQKVMFAFTE